MKHILAITLLAAAGVVHAVPERISLDPQDAVARLKANTGYALTQKVRAKSAYTSLRAAGPMPLLADAGVGEPESRARYFLSIYGEALGIQNPAEQLILQRISADPSGRRHAHLDQVHDGMPVFGARVIVHMDGNGITGVNGVFIPDLDKAPSNPTIDAGQLRASAVKYAIKFHPGRLLHATAGRWVMYPVGLLEGRQQGARVAHEVMVEAAGRNDVRDRIFVDARNGTILNRLSEVHTFQNREIYTPDDSAAPTYDESATTLLTPRGPADPALINDPGHNGNVASAYPNNVPQANLWIFAGGTYALYKNMFGRGGYDACDLDGPCQPDQAAPDWSPTRAAPFAGQLQKSIYLINDACPNAYWNGSSTNYCPGFDADDVVSHEWSHAYTQYTHGLIYQYQSGALNESYSDIFGETYDLLNKLEGPLGTLTLEEHKYYEEFGSRWVVGEDLSEEAAALLLRDMWKPDDFPAANPGKATSGNYTCGSGDGGGVHSNSSVPNHAYAMLVDGTAGQGAPASVPPERNTYNGQSFAGIGMVKAAHIYFRAENNYQTPSTDFPHHADALRQSCQDLKGVNLNGPTGAPSGQIIAQADCDILEKAMLATEMDLGSPCPFQQVLKPDAPAICDGAATIFSELWETGAPGWTKTSTGVFSEWNDSSRNLRDFKIATDLPAARAGKAAFALNAPIGAPGGGDCSPGTGDYSGQYTYDSPEITIPAGATNLNLRFEHYVATEATFDGGQLELSVNGGAFALLPPGSYAYNPPNSAFDAPPPVGLNTNPNADELAWNGADINSPSGSPPGSWGTTIVKLSNLAAPGAKIKLRLTYSQDGCNGVQGWIVDDFRVYSCPALEAPTLAAGADYENPDTDGSFTLNWNRPDGATGPDLVQGSTTSCAPILSENAESGLGQWNVTGGTGASWAASTRKKHGGSNSFWGQINEGSGADAFLTFKTPIVIPTVGATILGYWEFYVNEPDDEGLVEVSLDGGATWVTVNSNNRNLLAEDGAAALADEDLVFKSLDMSAYAGQTIRLRFQMMGGPSNYFFYTPYGWYLDDIALTNENWGNLLTTPSTSWALSNQLDGDRCYRVRSSYEVQGQIFAGKFSNILKIKVQAGLANLPPVADAGPDLSVKESKTAQLSGLASADPNLEPLSYRWTQVAGPLVPLQNAATATPSFTAPPVSTDTLLTFELTVEDAAGATGTDTVVVTVRDVPATLDNNKLGGAIPLASLLLLTLFGAIRRRAVS